MSQTYLEETPLLNYTHASIQSIIETNQWTVLTPYKKIGAVHHFVRDAIDFGYNHKDKLTASEVLTKKYGQCNTKSIVLMSLLRALNIPCKIEGFLVDSSFQGELLPKALRPFAPKHFLHTRVLVQYKENFVPLEGYILDKRYLLAIQKMYPHHEGPFSKYAVATDDLHALNIEGNGHETAIQKNAIVKSLGVYNDPDTLFDKHDQPMGVFKRFIYSSVVRHLMNKRVKKIRHQIQ